MTASTGPGASSQAPLISPCIGICRMDSETRLCLGCARTAEEISVWRKAAPEARDRIWAELPARRERLGLNIHRLDWTPKRLAAFVQETLRPNAGTWVMGLYGAVAEFLIGEREKTAIEVSGDQITATTERAAIRLTMSDGVRALQIGANSEHSESLIVLAVRRPDAQVTARTAIARIGADTDAVRPVNRDETLYDFGLGSSAAQFCIRSGDEALIRDVDCVVGQPWTNALPLIGPRIVSNSPARIVVSPIGRIEVYTRVPLPDERSPLGPHTHFLPGYLATGRETTPGLDIPEIYAPAAIFYPARSPSEGH